jgi:hypothetical protein
LDKSLPTCTRQSNPPSNNCLSTIATDLPPPINHIFVDFENVHKIDLAFIGSKAVNFTLLLGSRQTKLDVLLVEKLLANAATVQLVRLTSGGNNALDFAIAYYVGRAEAADPTGYFHIVSKDTGYDPLIEHLRSRHIHARRHDDFVTLTFTAPAKLTPPAPAAASKPKASSKHKVQIPIVDNRVSQLLEHFRKSSATRPKNKEKLISLLITHLGHKITEAEALAIVENLRQEGCLAIGEKGTVTYHLERK